MSTKIQWTATVHPDGRITPGETWNPIRARALAEPGKDKLGWHCERVSPGCQHCYAETINRQRFGTGLPYNRASRDAVDVFIDERKLTLPLHWRNPRRVFVCSMTDLFGEWVPDEFIDRVFAVMALTPQHTYQVLTKRPERMRAFLNECPYGTPDKNIWLGVSAEDQKRADERIPALLATPAAVRFISCEPLLGPVQMAHWLTVLPGGSAYEAVLDWVIAGGESGPGARPCNIGWIRDVVGQCRNAGVPVFVKQLGANAVDDVVAGTGFRLALRDRKGGDPSEWPADLRVREWPGVGR